MKHPVRDRIVILLCSLVALCIAAAAVLLVLGKISVEPAIELLGRLANNMDTNWKWRAALCGGAAVMALIALRLFSVILPAKKKHSSTFAIQQNENGMVRISVKALEALVQRCLSQHPEIKVVSSSLFSNEESVRVDVHVALQSDISMPLAISSLQKQIKRYLEACSGVAVEEVRVFVDGAIPANAATAESPYAIPASVLGQEQLAGTKEDEPLLVAVDEVPDKAEPVEAVIEEAAQVIQTEAPAEEIEAVIVDAEPAEATEEEAGEQA